MPRLEAIPAEPVQHYWDPHVPEGMSAVLRIDGSAPGRIMRTVNRTSLALLEVPEPGASLIGLLAAACTSVHIGGRGMPRTTHSLYRE